MLLAERTGRSLRLGRVLSSRRSRRRLLRRSCCCNLVVTRNPFLLVVMVARYNIKHRRIHKGFRVFQKTFAPTSVGFACSRISSNMTTGVFALIPFWRRLFFLLQAVRAVPRGRGLDRFRTSLAALGAKEAFALHGGFRTCLLTAPENVLRHR